MSTDKNDWEQGYIHVYTGNGKGKTTTCLGLALRAAGAGIHVFIAQFIKGKECSELTALNRFNDLITLKQYGHGCFIHGKPTQEDIDSARKGLQEVKEILANGKHRLIILDEVNVATYFQLFSVDELLELIELKPENIELVISGRNADQRIIDRADLVTEMQEIKHYYTQGVEARSGIEK